LSLLSNAEVLEVDQDALGKQAVCVASKNDLDVFAKPLEDGSLAVGLFNRSMTNATVIANFFDLKISGKQTVRDLWRQKDIGIFADKFEAPVATHGVILVRICPVD
jgi:alpha-galactosidase